MVVEGTIKTVQNNEREYSINIDTRVREFSWRSSVSSEKDNGRVSAYVGSAIQFDMRVAPPCNIVPLKELTLRNEENGALRQ